MFIKIDFTEENSHGDTVVSHDWINTDNITHITEHGEHSEIAGKFKYSVALTGGWVIHLKEEEFNRLKEALKF
jgi:hypothetical protein